MMEITGLSKKYRLATREEFEFFTNVELEGPSKLAVN